MRTLLVALLVGLVTCDAGATVIVQDTFEGTGQGCSQNPFWRDLPKWVCTGNTTGDCNTPTNRGQNCSCLATSECSAGGTCTFTDEGGALVGPARNGIAPQAGSCYAYGHWNGDDSSYNLNSSDVFTNWPVGTHKTREWHFVYWIYFDMTHSNIADKSGEELPNNGAEPTSIHPTHQKLGKWLVSEDWNSCQNCCTGQAGNIGHPMGECGDTTAPWGWESHLESSGGDCSVCCADCEIISACRDSLLTGTNAVTYGTWHKIEAYVKLNSGVDSAQQCDIGNGTIHPAGTCTGANDTMRVWVDDVLEVTSGRCSLNAATKCVTGSCGVEGVCEEKLGYGTSITKGLTKFWFLGNASCSSGSISVGSEGKPPNYWIYADNICIGTTPDDCAVAPFLGTKAALEFGTLCGNGVAEGAEVCDLTDLRGNTCATVGYKPVLPDVLVCNNTITPGDCTQFNTATCQAFDRPRMSLFRRFFKSLGGWLGL